MDYDIFREQLAASYPTYGYALWDPNPGGLYTAVDVGDVGFIRQGKFHRLFNVLLPGHRPSHQNFGVPEHYEPLVPRMQRHIFTGTLSPNDYYSGRVRVVSGGLELLASGQELARVKFSCSRKRGAILSLPVPAESKDTLARGDFARCLMTNVDVWFAFARDLGLGISRMDDIILVTGRHLARSSTNVAFFGHEGEREVSFRVRVPNSFGVEWQFSRQDIRGLAYNCGPSGSDLPQNQCIFIRGFRVRRRLRILPRLLGAAVPPGPGLGPGRDELISVSADTDNQDPVHIILDYLTTKAPDCDTALVHDDDLQYFVGASLENLQPDAVTGYLQTFMPNIERAQCDLFPVTRGGSGTEISVAKVASLSNYGFNVPAPQRNIKALIDDGNRAGPNPALNAVVASVVLEWHTEKSYHHARVLVTGPVGDLPTSTWPDRLSLRFGPAVPIENFVAWTKKRRQSGSTRELVMVSIQPATDEDSHDFDQLVKLLRESGSHADASWTIQGKDKPTGTRSLFLYPYPPSKKVPYLP